METNVNYTVVGVFVVTLTAAIVLSIIWLSSGFSFDKYNKFMVYMEESVSGLSVDSPVEFNGVQVGRVKSIALNPKNPKIVQVILLVKKNTPMTRGTVAMLSTRGITGFVYFTLIDTGTDHRALVIPPGDKYPVIPTQPSIFVRLDKALTQISNGFQRISEILFTDQNMQNLSQIFKNMQQFTNTLSTNSHNLDEILQNLRGASKQFDPVLQSTRGTMRTIQMQTLPAAYQALRNLQDTTQNLNALARELKQNPSMLIRGRAAGKPGPGE